MSRGIGAHANKIAEDNSEVIYEYGGYNLNNPAYMNEEHNYDGIITIEKNCFTEHEINEKIKRRPSGRKELFIKRIPVSVDYPKMLQEGKIRTENCSNCWNVFDDEMDVMISHILFYIFLRYQEDGKVPESISYNV